MNFKRILSTVLAVVMVLGTMTLPTFAADTMPADTGVVTLTEDVTLADTYTIPAEVTNIDLGGFTLTANGIIVENNIEITNGTLTMPQIDTYGSYVLTIAGDATVTLDNVTVEGGVGDVENANNGIILKSTGDIQILNSVINGGDITRGDDTAVKYDKTAGMGLDIEKEQTGAVSIENTTINGGEALYTGEGYPFSEYASNMPLLVSGGVAVETYSSAVTVIKNSKIYGGNSALKDAGDGLCVGGASNDITLITTEIKGGDCFNTKENRGVGGDAITVYTTASAPKLVVESSTVAGGNGSGSYAGSGIDITPSSTVLDIKDSSISGGTEGTNNGYAIDLSNSVKNVKLENTEIIAGQSGTAINGSGWQLSEFVAEISGDVKISGTADTLAIAGAAEGATLQQKASTDTDYTDTTSTVKKYVAKIDNVMYETFKDAALAATDNDTITLLSDITIDTISFDENVASDITVEMNEKTVTFSSNNSNKIYVNGEDNVVTFKNGTFDIVGSNSSEAIFNVATHSSYTMAPSLVFDNVDIINSGAYNLNYCYVFYAGNGNIEFINGSNVDLTAVDENTIFFGGANGTGNYIIKDSSINLEGGSKGFLNNNIDIQTGSDVTMNGVKEGLRNINGSISGVGTTITITNSTKHGINEENGTYELKITEGASVNVYGSAISDIKLQNASTVDIDNESKLAYRTADVSTDDGSGNGSAINFPKRTFTLTADDKESTETAPVSIEAGDIVEVALSVDGQKLRGLEWTVTYDATLFEYVGTPTATGEIKDYDQQTGTGYYDSTKPIRTYKFKALKQTDEVTGEFSIKAGSVGMSLGEALSNVKVEPEIIPAFVKIALNTDYAVTVTIDDEVVVSGKENRDGTKTVDFETLEDGSVKNHVVKVIPEFDEALLGAKGITFKVNGTPVDKLVGYNFGEEGTYVIEYTVDGPDGFGDVSGTVTLNVVFDDYVVEVNLLKDDSTSDYVKGVAGETVAKKLVLVYTNTDQVSFTYDGNLMLDVTKSGYKYVDHSANAGAGTAPAAYKHVYGYVTDVIDNAEIDAYEAKISHKCGNKAQTPRVVTYGEPNPYDLTGDLITDAADLTTSYGVYNAMQEDLFETADMWMDCILKADINCDKFINYKDTNAVRNAVYPIQ